MRMVALLRGINVGGKNLVSMADLRKIVADLGYGNPTTLLQSGNVIFDAPQESPSEVEIRLKSEIESRLGLPVEVHARTGQEIEGTVSRNPFPEEALSDPSHLLVMFFRDAIRGDWESTMTGPIVGRERFIARDREAYIFYPDGIGSSKLTNAAIDRRLGQPGTARNWNTVVKLETLAAHHEKGAI